MSPPVPRHKGPLCLTAAHGDLPICDRRCLHRYAPDREPARSLHRRARDPGGRPAAARARDELLRDNVRLPATGRRPCADADLHAAERASVRGAPDPRHRLRARRPAAARRDSHRDAAGRRTGAARARRGAHHVRDDGAAAPGGHAVRAYRGAAFRARRRQRAASGRALRQRRRARLCGRRIPR